MKFIISGKATLAITTIEVVASIPEMVFAVLLFIAICIFWINWFKDENHKE
jgi:hypothetical protein